MNVLKFRNAFMKLSIIAMLAHSSPGALADFVDSIYYPQPNGTAWLTQGGASDLVNPTDIESFDAANEFVVTSPSGVRNYYFSGNTLNYVQMTVQADYTSIADMGNQQASYVAVGASGRVDRIFAVVNDWNTTTIIPAGTLTGTVRVESYDTYGVFVTLSNEGVRYYNNSGGLDGQISNRTDYVSICDNGFGNNNETFFALAADGSVDRIKYDGSGPFGYTTTSILSAGSIPGPKDIESYDGNNEFVTVGTNGVREYYFSGGSWAFDQMSTSADYFRIADNGSDPADYFALRKLVGDYNGDLVVDSADYVAWRKNPGANGGDPAGYDAWRANFGSPLSGSGSSLGVNTSNVPEPGAIFLAIVAGSGLIKLRRKRGIRC